MSSLCPVTVLKEWKELKLVTNTNLKKHNAGLSQVNFYVEVIDISNSISK
jgi:hypothetical protein